MIQIFFITSTHHTDHTPICQHNTPLNMILHSKNLELVFNILGMKTEIHANFIDENNILAISIWVSKGVVLECLTFLKSLLSSLPTYLSLFTILTFVTKDWRLQKKNCGCGASDEFKFFLVDRNIVCAPIENQSMGLCVLDTSNQAMLGKWLWRHGVKGTRFWRQVVGLKVWGWLGSMVYIGCKLGSMGAALGVLHLRLTCTDRCVAVNVAARTSEVNPLFFFLISD